MRKELLKRVSAVILCTAMALSFTGCGSSGDSDVSVGDGAGKDTDGIHLNLTISEEINSLDPNYNYSATSIGFITNVNEGLYKYGADGNLTLGMASDVQVSEDGKTYTFTIRDDAKWTNGDSVTANDFYYSWRRLANPDNGCVYAYMLITAGVKNAYDVVYNGASLDELGVSCPDEKTFVVELDSPKSYFTELLASGVYFMPVNQKFCEEMGDQFMLDKEHSIYCGAYTMTEWEVGGTSYTFTKNPMYYAADEVTTDSMHYTLMTDKQQQILAWENGTLDSVQLTGDYISMYAGDDSLWTMDYPGLFFIAFNTKDQYFANKNLRLAVSTAIDKTPIVQSVLADGSVAADYAIPAGFAKDSKGVTYRENAGNPVYNTYDLAKAKEYWEAAKKELGVDSITVEFLYNEDSQLASVAQYIQQQLQTNLEGFQVTLKVATYNQRLQDMGSHNYQFGITRWYADYQDASTYLDMWIDGSSLNYEAWHNDEYNELYTKVVGEYALMEEERIAAQAQMEKIIMEDAAICPLYQPAFVYLQNQEYTYTMTPSGTQISKYTHRK